MTHKRLNILTGEWVLVSPHRTKRPWQGKSEDIVAFTNQKYDPDCYLCPTNKRASGAINPDYKEPYAFTNDFAALVSNNEEQIKKDGLLIAQPESGTSRVICFSSDHSLTLPLMELIDIVKVIKLWQQEFEVLGSKKNINYVQIFENKGAIMGCSNPHPHGQIWAQRSIPDEVLKKTTSQLSYFKENKNSLLADYLKQELSNGERIVYKNNAFVVLVPYWAIWPYEVMIIPKRKMSNISLLTEQEQLEFADAIKVITTKYDNIFNTSFPYSNGIHQAPTDGSLHEEWHWHMSFYPPLLRSATVKKFMVGYEMFANPQRDISAEQAAQTLRDQSQVHYTLSL